MTDLYERRIPVKQDAKRAELITFLIHWLQGRFMSMDPKQREGKLSEWEEFASIFPPRATKPIRLMRLVTLPIEYASQKRFHLEHPAPFAAGSWTSTHMGIDSVAGIAVEKELEGNVNGWGTCRLAIRATIQPENILATPRSIKSAFLALTHDWDYDKHDYYSDNAERYLDIEDETVREDIGYIQSILDEVKGGFMRQYEYIVRTTPLDVEVVRVYRVEDKQHHMGHDDPHNSGNYRGWSQGFSGWD